MPMEGAIAPPPPFWLRYSFRGQTLSRPRAEMREAKAKNLTFEAKAEDFKMCPRGRPQGLHLRKPVQNVLKTLHIGTKFSK